MITVTTDNHIVETTRQDFEMVKKFCEENKITLDYYMFEFMNYGDPREEVLQ
tara:strand:- start:41 stop:196 length:156 start_codon:yes stop_codon:yes gene_type:complete